MRAPGWLPLVALLAVAPTCAGASAESDAPSYLCRAAGAGGKSRLATAAVTTTDRFATRHLDLRSPRILCRASVPATEMLSGIPARVARTRPRGPRKVGVTLDVVTRLGASRIAVRAIDRVLAPAAIGDAAASLADTNPLTCYRVGQARKRGKRPRLVIDDGSGEQTIDVGRATRLCVPAGGTERPELLCHAARLVADDSRPKSRPASVSITNAFGTTSLRMRGVREVCVPVLGSSDPPPPPPPPPAPGLTLAVTPSSLEVIAGTRPQLRATAYFDDGGHADYTDKVVWTSSDETIADVLSSSVGGAMIDTVGRGTAIISVTDPETAVSSHDSGGDATLTVTWPLETLTISPHAVTKKPGGHEDYTVIGYFTGGFTRNLTQRVHYTSTNPAVAEAPNTPGKRSRVLAKAPGTAIIGATDPISGLRTSDVGNDAILHVAGELVYILVQNAGSYDLTLFPGETHNMTAIGYYADGTTKNFTQKCTWQSENPDVVLADNPPDNRGRLTAVGIGQSYVRCVDPTHPSVPAYGAYVAVVGELVRIEAYGGDYWPLELGESHGVTALGVYAPFENFCCSGRRNLTQDVVWASRDPEIASTPNTPGNRSQVVGESRGTARIYATDPVSGIVSNDVDVVVLGELLALELIDGPHLNRIAAGGRAWYRVGAFYEGGWLRLRPYDFKYKLESSNPVVAAPAEDGLTVLGVSAGVATITARHLAADITSPGVPLTVQGGLESITLTPATATRGIGEWESFTAIGHYPPDDATELVTQSLVYSSSDPAVAVADNVPGSRSRVRTVGAGTAVITATHPPTGITATATLTVLPGAIERVTIQPTAFVGHPRSDFAFTAIGHYPDGSTINVTQVVTWTSLAPQVAQAPNEPGNRSRVVAVAPGTAMISARHPSGVSSADSGDDVAFIVKAITDVTLTPTSHVGHVGDVLRFTVVGKFADGTTTNLTQEASYWAEDSTIAFAENADGDRSALVLVGPGTTTVHVAPLPGILNLLLFGRTATVTVEP